MTAAATKPLAFYARVSRLGGRSAEDLRSVEMQRREATAAARALGFDVDTEGIFEDLDVSGATEIADRPGLSRALAAVEAGRFGGVAIAWQSRADRSGGRILEELQARVRSLGAVLVIADAPTANVFPGVEAADGYLALPQRVRAIVERAQREDAAAKFRESRRGAIERGRKVGRATLGYAHGPDGLVVDEDAAALVHKVFVRRAAGEAISSLAAFLTASGARPPSRKSEMVGWAHSTVRQLLANETYLGVVWHGPFRNEDAHPAIVSRGEFDAVRVQPTGFRPLGTSTADRLLLGLARCSGCGRTLKVVRRNRADGSYAVSYYCKGTASSTASSPSRGARRLVDVVAVIVRPRRTLRYGGAVHLPGGRLELPEEEADTLAAHGTVRYATEDAERGIREAVEKRLPVEGYSAPRGPEDEPRQDPADPDSVHRRTAAKRRVTKAAP